ncbi:MAG: hypothetical protein KAW41_05660 [Candidatus Diapherotrites archaeon]|nr:hypothetical protein [Candidatus Diapherotrites archaeon]
MIVTDTKPFGMIKAGLKKGDEVSVVSCNQCARLCGTGGKEGLDEMKEKLGEGGYGACDEFLFAPVCDESLCRKILKPKGSVILVLACEAGVSSIKRVFKTKKVISALNTTGLGAFDEDGCIFMVREFK